jgi:hypothetical protein
MNCAGCLYSNGKRDNHCIPQNVEMGVLFSILKIIMQFLSLHFSESILIYCNWPVRFIVCPRDKLQGPTIWNIIDFNIRISF